MIYKPDEKVMKAFAALRSNENFKVISLYLADCLDRTDQDCRKTVEEHKVRWLQGQAQDLDELLRLIERSRKL